MSRTEYLFIGFILLLMALSLTANKFLAALPLGNRIRFRAFLLACQARGWEPIITSGVRSAAEQLKQHQANPKNPATVGTHDGRALDLNFVKGAVHLKKATPPAVWRESGIIALAKSFGIKWGGEIFKSYYDPVHFQV